MKRIGLIIISLLIGVLSYGQNTSVQGGVSVSGDVNATNITEITSTVTENRDDLSALSTNTSGLAGWKIELNTTLDSLVFTLGNAVYKVPIGETEESDVTAPTVNSAEIGNVEDSLVYIFVSESVDSLVTMTAWDIKQNDVSVGLDTMWFTGGSTIVIALDSSLSPQTNITASYTRPRNSGDIQDASGNYLASFTDQAVTNNINTNCVEVGVSTHYSFETGSVTTDRSGNSYTLTAYNGATNTTSEYKEGVSGADLNGFNRYFLRPTRTIGDELSVSFYFKEYWDPPVGLRTAWTTLQSNQGVEIQLYSDGATGQVRVITGNGTSTATATSSTGLSFSSAFHHVVATINNSGVKIYFDNVDVTLTSSVQVGFGGASTARIGLDYDNDKDLFGYIDGLQEYDAILTTTQVDSLYDYANESIMLVDCGDPPIPDGDIITYWSLDWADWSIQQTLPKDTLTKCLQNFTGIMTSDGSDDIYNWVDIVDFEGERWAKSWYLQGQCCTEVEWTQDIANGGTGMDIIAYITDASTHYKEVYLSYDVYWDAVVGDFVNSAGHKMPGLSSVALSNYPADPYVAGRIMAINTDNGSSNLDPGYYITSYSRAGGFDDPDGAQTTNSTRVGYPWFESGRKINITLRFVFSDVNSYNGLLELFVDGVFIGGQSPDAIWPGSGIYSIPWYKSGSSDGFGVVMVSTFMGGYGTEYLSPKDQFLLLGKMKVWMYDDDVADVPRGSTPSSPMRNITGALTTLGFY